MELFFGGSLSLAIGHLQQSLVAMLYASALVRLLPFPMNVPCRAFSNARCGRAERGLYAGRGLSFGNRISAFGNRVRRSWKPNIQHAALFSELLGRRVRARVSTEALRLIDRAGGLDNYILAQRLPESLFAAKLKAQLVDAVWARELQGANEERTENGNLCKEHANPINSK
jgi:ribosomal protein L28